VKIPFAAQSSKDTDNPWASSARLLNCYRERVGDNQIMKQVPRQGAFANLSGVFLRAIDRIDGEIYAVHGGKLQKIDKDGVVASLADIPDDENTSISGNNGKVSVVADGNYYVWDGATLSQPSTGNFSDVGSVSFFNQLTVITKRDDRTVQWSDPADASSFNALNFATAETKDDKNIRGLQIGGSFWVFKENSIEQWASRANGNLSGIPGAQIDTGLKSFNLVVKIPRGAFLIGSDNKAYLMSGGLTPVSSVAVETSIKTENPIGTLYYQDEGHEFCAITFRDRPAWVYDIATGEWHERAEGLSLLSWGARAGVEAYGEHFVCSDDGSLSKLSRDGSEVMTSKAVSTTYENDGNRFFIDRLEFKGSVGRVSGDPQVLLRTSRDHGQTWSEPKNRSMGQVGDLDARIVYRGLGEFKQATFELSWTEPLTFAATAFMDAS